MPLSRGTSVKAQQVIQRAFKELERAVSVTDACRFRDMTIQDVRRACEVLENELGARGLLRNMERLQPLLRGLECYGKAIDTLCQGTPFLPWIWAPIVTILKIGSDCISAFETLIKAYARIGKSLTRFEMLRHTFESDPQFQEIVAIFYRDIVKFHECAYKFVTVNGWRRFFRTTWGRFERQFTAVLDNLDKHGELIDKEANARNITNTQELLQQLESERKEKLEHIRSEEKKEIARQYQAILTRLQVNESDQASIWETLLDSLAAGHEGTCSWILRHEKIASWLQNTTKVRSIWLQGTTGTGKSVIAAHVARFRSADNHIVICHYCNDLYESSTKYDQILKSIIRQLLEKSDDATAHAYRALVIERKPLSITTLEPLVQELLAIASGSHQDLKPIWIILDGMDICEAASFIRCISLMDLVTTKNSELQGGSCKVLFTSRREPPSKGIRKRSLVLLSEEVANIQQSIRLYTVRRLQLSPVSDRLSQLGLASDEVTKLAEDVASKADGMFLYARLIIDYLSKQLFGSGQELKQALHDLPPELKGFYRKIMSDIISHLSPMSIANVERVLHWIGFSNTPLKRKELLSAVTFSQGHAEINQLVPSFFLQDCFALLEEKSDKTIGFIHATVRDFLLHEESPISISQESAQRQHMLATLACLASAARHLINPTNSQNTHHLIIEGVFAFLNYASKHWAQYVLCYAETCLRQNITDAEFERELRILASRLDATFTGSAHLRKRAEAVDARVTFLHKFSSIRPYVEAALVFQSQEPTHKTSAIMDQEDQERSTQRRHEFVDAVSVILRKYRDAVRTILSRGYYLGVSREDFEKFRAEGMLVLFTCRQPSCPRASTGFETEADLLAHEVEHSKGFPCREGGCPFPPFRSSHLLERHVSRHHRQFAAKKTLKRVEEFHVGAINYQTSSGIQTGEPVLSESHPESVVESLARRPPPRSTLMPQRLQNWLPDNGYLGQEYPLPTFLDESVLTSIDGNSLASYDPGVLNSFNFDAWLHEPSGY